MLKLMKLVISFRQKEMKSNKTEPNFWALSVFQTLIMWL